MTETYAFLSMFTLQILGSSVLLPLWLWKDLRAKMMALPDEHLAALFLGVDPNKTLERHLMRYRVMNTVIAVLGLLLLGWFLSYVQRPDWQGGPVKSWVLLYAMVQLLPTFLVGSIMTKYKTLLERLLEQKRKAVLQRRGLFDFVSPLTVFIVVGIYFLFVAYVIYLERYSNIIFVTLLYALNAFLLYRAVYSRKVNPLETHATRMHEIGLRVKAYFYLGIAIVVFRSIRITFELPDLERWKPFWTSFYFVFVVLLGSIMIVAESRRRPEPDGFGSDQKTRAVL